MSKFIKRPNFPELPPSTDSANCKENIDVWLERGMTHRIETYLKPDPNGYKGYRFISHSDFQEKTEPEPIEILGVAFMISYKRSLAYDHFCPLWFREQGWGFFLNFGDYRIDYRNDTQFKRVLTGLKKEPYTGENTWIQDYKDGNWITLTPSDKHNFYSGYFGR